MAKGAITFAITAEARPRPIKEPRPSANALASRPPRIVAIIVSQDLREKSDASTSDMVSVSLKTAAAPASLLSGAFSGRMPDLAIISKPPATKSAVLAALASSGMSSIGTRAATRRKASAFLE